MFRKIFRGLMALSIPCCLFILPFTIVNASQEKIKAGNGPNPPLIIMVGGVGDSTYSSIVYNLAHRVAKDQNYRTARVWYMDHESEKDVVRQIAQHRCQNPYAKIVLVGHSMGGDTVIDVRDNDGVGPIDLVVTLDGVSGSVFDDPDNLYEIRRWINVYPSKDKASRGVLFGQNWREENSATVNMPLEYALDGSEITHSRAGAMYAAAEHEVLAVLRTSFNQSKLDSLSSNINAIVNHPKRKAAYFFIGDQYRRYQYGLHIDKTGTVGTDGWRNGVWPDVDAAVYHPERNAFYFFKGNKYQKYESGVGVTKEAIIGSGKFAWPGVWSDLDAAVYYPQRKAFYFFKGNKYQRYQSGKGVTKTGIIGKNGWPGVWSNIDAAFYNPDRGAFYFFKGRNYQKRLPGSKGISKTASIGGDNWSCL